VGTTFTFSLPYRVKGNPQAKSDSNTSATVSRKDIRKIAGTKVLVVEANPMNGELLLKRLDAWDCEVFLVPNAEDALKLLTIQEIDLILMDLRMPGINGLEATERIRNHVLEHIRKVPVIAVTADFGIKDREACEAYGIQDYLLKPYSAKELMGKLCWAKTYNEDMETRESGAFSLEGGMPSDNGTALDLKAVLEECMGDKTLLAELVRLFKQNCLEFIGKTRIALDHGDMESIAQGCHKIKAGLAMLKVHNLHKLVCQLQPACEQEPDVKHIKFLYGCFVEEFPLVSAALDRKMTELGM
jgi:CheY-like chemotaxis protein